MTNEEIIRTATESFYRDYLPKQPLPEAIGELTFKVMELKTLQVKELLEKNRTNYPDFMNGTDTYAFGMKEGYVKAFDKIINELFNKD